MRGDDLVEALRQKLSRLNPETKITDKLLADFLGTTPTNLKYHWTHRESLSPLQVANLVVTAMAAARKDAHDFTLRPIVEFFPLVSKVSARSKKVLLFDAKEEGNKPQLYLQGLRRELDSHHGIYVFYDSRGSALYAGKAKRLSLWVEMIGAFNRKRPVSQSLYRVRHPQGHKDYKTSDEQERQIRRVGVPLHELAAYFSAYEVPDAMIDSLEALLVRGFANDLLNVRMEKFATGKGKAR